MIHSLDDSGQLRWLEERGISLVRGEARLDGERRVLVGEATLTARRAVVIAVGSGAAIPPIPGLLEISPWTNRAATIAKAVPDRLTILGGGVVGCELSQAWSSLGAHVALVESLPRLLAGEEPFASHQVETALRQRGVDLRLGSKATKAARDRGGEFTLTLEDGATIASDELLVAVGRRPHTDTLGLETVDLEPAAMIAVDGRMRVPGRDWLFAVGDVNGRALLTQAAEYQARIAADVILNRDVQVVSTADGPLTPRYVFTDPQVAAVGHTLESALEHGIVARALDAEFGATAAASFIGKNPPGNGANRHRRRAGGHRRRHLHRLEVADSIHAATVAVIGEVSLRRLAHGSRRSRRVARCG